MLISCFQQGYSTQHDYQGKLRCVCSIATETSLLLEMLRQAYSAVLAQRNMCIKP